MRKACGKYVKSVNVLRGRYENNLMYTSKFSLTSKENLPTVHINKFSLQMPLPSIENMAPFLLREQ